MNPITQTKNLMKINDRELEMGVAGTKNSWHQEYKVDVFLHCIHVCFVCSASLDILPAELHFSL